MVGKHESVLNIFKLKKETFTVFCQLQNKLHRTVVSSTLSPVPYTDTKRENQNIMM